MLSNQDNEPFIAKNDALGYVHGEKLYKQIESHFEAYLIKLHQVAPFVQDSAKFYQREATTFINENPINEYLRWVAQCLVDEENRIKSYLHPSTLEPILKILDNVLIRDNLDRILDEAEFLFNNSRNQVYINTILGGYKKYMTLIKECFEVDISRFILVLEHAFTKVLNRNAVTIAAHSSTKSSELLALFSNIIFQINNDIDDTNIQKYIEDIMIVFKCIENKDAFHNFYWQMLAERLVYERSASVDYEKMMITEFQKECGHMYTLKLNKMIENFCLKENLMKKYQEHCENQQSLFNFSCMVLATNLWPFSVISDFNLPFELASSIDNFIQFYCHQHNKQKLTWLYQYSRGELHAYFTKSTYVLQVSAYEMVILLLYNNSLEWTIEQIYKKTHIKTDILMEILYILIKSDLLTCLQIRKEDLKEKNLQMGHMIRLNDNFT
ncbi:unnamed protein product, partial [Rotaria sp. Silwood1]